MAPPDPDPSTWARSASDWRKNPAPGEGCAARATLRCQPAEREPGCQERPDRVERSEPRSGALDGWAERSYSGMPSREWREVDHIDAERAGFPQSDWKRAHISDRVPHRVHGDGLLDQPSCRRQLAGWLAAFAAARGPDHEARSHTGTAPRRVIAASGTTPSLSCKRRPPSCPTGLGRPSPPLGSRAPEHARLPSTQPRQRRR